MFEEKIDVCVRLENYGMRWFGPKSGLKEELSVTGIKDMRSQLCDSQVARHD